MRKAPERIRVAQDAEGFWTCREAITGSQEYVRVDTITRLEAENAELRKDRERDLDAISAALGRYSWYDENDNWRSLDAMSKFLAGKVEAEHHARCDADRRAEDLSRQLSYSSDAMSLGLERESNLSRQLAERDEELARTFDPDRLASIVANIRQGESETPRCESPGEADIAIARSWVVRVLKALATEREG